MRYQGVPGIVCKDRSRARWVKVPNRVGNFPGTTPFYHLCFSPGFGQCQWSEFRMNVSILVIDDEAPIRRMLTSCLSDQGYRVVTVATAAEGRALLRQS